MRNAARFTVFLTLVTLGGMVTRTAPRAQAPAQRSVFDALHFRDIGPVVTSGRLHDIQIDPKNPAVLYVAAASGGLWKSSNKGVTWKPISPYLMSGARTGTLAAPTGAMRAGLADAKTDLAAIERESRKP